MRKPCRERKKGGKERERERESMHACKRHRKRERVVWLTTPFCLDPVSVLESFLPRPLYRQLLLSLSPPGRWPLFESHIENGAVDFRGCHFVPRRTRWGWRVFIAESSRVETSRGWFCPMYIHIRSFFVCLILSRGSSIFLDIFSPTRRLNRVYAKRYSLISANTV